MFSYTLSKPLAWLTVAFLCTQVTPNEGAPEFNLRAAASLSSSRAQLPGQGSTTPSLSLINNKNVQYYGKIGVGNPPQVFDVLFDTGSGDSWIPGVQSKYYPKKTEEPRELFYANQSSTFKDDGTRFIVQYGTGNVEGRWFTDDVHVAGVVVKAQDLVQADSLGLGTAETFFDGVFGLGYTMNNKLTFYRNMFAQNLIPEPIYSIYLKRTTNLDPSAEVFGGELLFGAIDWDKIEGDKIHYSNVVNHTDNTERWQIRIDGISVGQTSENSAQNDVKNFCPGKCRTIVDSGASFIVGPNDEVAKINKLLGGVKIKGNEYVIPDCNTTNLPNLLFTIEGVEFALKPEHYIARVTENGSVRCYTGVMGLPFLFGDGEPLWILGTAFMAQYYTVFDFGQSRIGFAPLRDSSLIP